MELIGSIIPYKDWAFHFSRPLHPYYHAWEQNRYFRQEVDTRNSPFQVKEFEWESAKASAKEIPKKKKTTTKDQESEQMQ